MSEHDSNAQRAQAQADQLEAAQEANAALGAAIGAQQEYIARLEAAQAAQLDYIALLEDAQVAQAAYIATLVDPASEESDTDAPGAASTGNPGAGSRKEKLQ